MLAVKDLEANVEREVSFLLGGRLRYASAALLVVLKFLGTGSTTSVVGAIATNGRDREKIIRHTEDTDTVRVNMVTTDIGDATTDSRVYGNTDEGPELQGYGQIISMMNNLSQRRGIDVSRRKGRRHPESSDGV